MGIFWRLSQATLGRRTKGGGLVRLLFPPGQSIYLVYVAAIGLPNAVDLGISSISPGCQEPGLRKQFHNACEFWIC
eukprot:9224196-Pyramimonas_sp.AAC.2